MSGAEAHTLIEGFQTAAFDDAAWAPAVRSLASATGSRLGQIIGLSSARSIAFNWAPDAPDSLVNEFVAANGGDPDVNPRVKAGARSPLLRSIVEADFITPEKMASTPIYADLFTRKDIPFICRTDLIRTPSLRLCLSVVRTARQGHIEPQERAVFDAVSPHVQAAARMRMRLGDEGAALAVGALETMESCAFVIGAAGQVRAMTNAASQLISEASRLDIRSGALVARGERDAPALDQLLWNARQPQAQAGQVLLRGRGEAPPWLVDISPLPQARHSFNFGAAAVVIVRRLGAGRAARVGELSRALFGLTPTESRIVAALVAGDSLADISESRGVAIGTVRSQVRSILSKAGVSSQRELVSQFASLG
jgi:DNA-binding CsgD family transcriptional regulator